MKKGLVLVMTIALVTLLVGAGFAALFSDTETAAANTFTAGSLDLQVNGEDDPITMKFSVDNIAPGYDSGYSVWCLENVGSLPGQPYVEFSAITNSENGTTEPEDIAEGEAYARAEGELGQYLKYVIGVGPCGWSVPSLLSSMWQTGPVHPWGTPGLDALAGNTYFKGPTGYKFPVLDTGDTYGFFMKVSLDENLRIWDGTKWVEMDDNLIQTDGVEFDITFGLEQVP